MPWVRPVRSLAGAGAVAPEGGGDEAGMTRQPGLFGLSEQGSRGAAGGGTEVWYLRREASG